VGNNNNKIAIVPVEQTHRFSYVHSHVYLATPPKAFSVTSSIKVLPTFGLFFVSPDHDGALISNLSATANHRVC